MADKVADEVPLFVQLQTRPIEEDAVRKDRRTLLIVSVTAFFVAMTRSVPTGVSALGIDLRGTDKPVIVVFFFLLLLAYFLYTFWQHATGSVRTWVLKTDATVREFKESRELAFESARDHLTELATKTRVYFHEKSPVDGRTPKPLNELTPEERETELDKFFSPSSYSTLRQSFMGCRKGLGEDSTVAYRKVHQWMHNCRKHAMDKREFDESDEAIELNKFVRLLDDGSHLTKRFQQSGQAVLQIYRRRTMFLDWYLPLAVGWIGIVALVFLLALQFDAVLAGVGEHIQPE